MQVKREIIITADGSKTIHMPEWNENYHSSHGALQEAKHVFLKYGLEYFKDQKEMIDSVRIKDPILADNLEQLQTSLIQKRSIGYQLGRISKKIARLRINIPSLLWRLPKYTERDSYQGQFITWLKIAEPIFIGQCYLVTHIKLLLFIFINNLINLLSMKYHKLFQ